MALFPGGGDVEFMKSINRELYMKFLNPIKFYPRAIGLERIDKLYGEPDWEMWHEEPIIVPAFVEYNIDRRRVLELFGKDELRDMIIWLSVPVMDDLGIRPKSGDVFIIDGKEFEVMDENLRAESLVLNENIHLDYAYSLNMRRVSTTRDDRVDVEASSINRDEGNLGDTGYPADYNYPEGPYDP